MAKMMKYCFCIVVAMVLMGTCANALSVKNSLSSNITIKNLPGCCNNCTVGKPCPHICRECLPVVVEPKKSVVLDIGVGPFPLYDLVIENGGKNYCPDSNDISYLTSKGNLRVGEGPPCDKDPPSIRALIADISFGHVILQPLCLKECKGDDNLLLV